MTTKGNDDSIITTSQYEYDLNNNTIKEITNEKEKTYTYDSLNRLKTSSIGISYTYDKAGNIQTKTQADGKVTAYTYNAKNELTNAVTQKDLQVLSQINYTYDKNGNQIEENETKVNGANENETNTTKYVYNAKNELEEVKLNDKQIEKYTYDGEGKRTKKQDESGITKYVYDEDKVIIETDDNGNEKATNTYGLSLIKRKAKCRELVEENQNLTDIVINNLNESEVLSEEIIQNTEEGPQEKESIKTGYYLYNGHGDVINIVDKENNILNTYEYDEFGQVTQESENLDNAYKYAGYIQDKATQNYYLNARYYNPAIQRFISEDTVRGNLEDPLSLNLYTYSHNNPLKYVDPSGHIPIPLITALIGGAVNAGANFIGDILDDGKINRGYKSYIGAAAEGAIIGGAFGIIGTNAGGIITGITAMTSGTVGSATNQYISTGNVDIKQSLIDGTTLTVGTLAFGVGESVTTKGITNIKDYAVKGLKATIASNFTNQTLTKGITNIDIKELVVSSLIGAVISGGSVAISNAFNNVFGKISDKYFPEWLQKGENNYKVYKAYDKKGNKVYTGITKQAIEKRLYQHKRNGKNFNELKPVAENLTKNQSRAIEQFLIEKGDANEKNMINSISKDNVYYKKAFNWARRNRTGIFLKTKLNHFMQKGVN